MGNYSKNLGQVAALYIGSTAPTNTAMIWYDTNSNQHKVFNTVEVDWLVLNTASVPGTVSSVGIALPSSVFNVSGTPVTGAGTLTGTFKSQTKGTVFAAPDLSTSDGVPTFRQLNFRELSDTFSYTSNAYSFPMVNSGETALVPTKVFGSNVIAVNAISTTTLPAFTYSNGASGVGATMTADANGAFPTINGVTLVATNKFLYKDAASGIHNGVWVLTNAGSAGTPWLATRDTSSDSTAEVNPQVVIATSGTLAGIPYSQVEDNVTIGTDPMTYMSPNDTLGRNFWKLDLNNLTAIKGFGTKSSHAIPFYTANTEKMRLLTTGELAINSTTASGTLHVKGLSGQSPVYFSNNAGTQSFEFRDDGNIYRNGIVNSRYFGYNQTLGEMAGAAIVYVAPSVSGYSNNLFGYYSGYQISSGRENAGFGRLTLGSLTTGKRNTAIGHAALSSLIASDENTAIGYSAASAITSGQYNVFAGFLSGANITSGNGNTVIGGFLKGTSGTRTSSVYVGYSNYSHSSYECVIGGSDPVTNYYLGGGKYNSNILGGLVNILFQPHSPAAVDSGYWTPLSNFNGVNWTFGVSQPTGTGTAGDINWQYAPTVQSSGTIQNALVTGMTFKGTTGQLQLGDTTAALTQSMFKLQNVSGSISQFVSNTSPENIITGSPGDTCYTTTGTNYVKASGTATNTGWLALATSASVGSITINSTGISSGTATRVLFENASNQISQSSVFTFDTADNNTLKVGSASTFGAVATQSLVLWAIDASGKRCIIDLPTVTGVSDINISFPADEGSNGYFLKTNGTGTTSWAAASISLTDTYVGVGNGSSITGTSNFTWNDTTKIFSVYETSATLGEPLLLMNGNTGVTRMNIYRPSSDTDSGYFFMDATGSGTVTAGMGVTNVGTATGGASISFNAVDTAASLSSILFAVDSLTVVKFADSYVSLNAKTTTTTELRFYEATTNGANLIGFRAPTGRTSNTDLMIVLPVDDPTAGQAMVFGAPSGGVSVASWVTLATGTGDLIQQAAGTQAVNQIPYYTATAKELTKGKSTLVFNPSTDMLTTDKLTISSLGGGGSEILTTDNSGVIGKTSFTTKGDILVYDGVDPAILAAAADFTFLIYDSSTGTGFSTVAFGSVVGDVVEIGANLSNSQVVETNGSAQLISVAKGTAYNKSFGTGTTNIAEIGATLGNSKWMMTDGSGKLVTTNTVPFNAAGDTLTGTGGAGFFGGSPQSSAPSTPAANNWRLYADAAGLFSWVKSDGFTRKFDDSGITASRTWTLPNVSGEIEIGGFTTTATSNGTVTFTVTSNRTQEFTGSTQQQIVSLGDCTTYLLGRKYKIINSSTNIIIVTDTASVVQRRMLPYEVCECTCTNIGTSAGAWSVEYRMIGDMSRHSFWKDDFEINSVTSSQFAITANGTAAAANFTVTTGLTSSQTGLVELNTGTTAAGRVTAQCGNISFFFSGGVHVFETYIYLPALSTASEEFILYIGFGDVTGSGNMVDGAYFRYDRTASVNWSRCTATASSRTINHTSTAVAATTWTKLRIEMNAAGTRADYYINGVNVGNETATIPTSSSNPTSCIIKIEKTASAGSANSTMIVDWAERHFVRTTAH